MKKSLKLIRNFLIFLIISSGSIFFITLLHEEKIDISIIPLKFTILATIISLSSIIIEVLRIKMIAKTLNKKIKLKTCLDSIVGHEFLSAITPFGGGGQPLSIYIMHKEGLSLGESVTISYIQTLYTIIILFIAGFISIPLFPSVLESKTLQFFIIGSLIAIIYFFGFSYFSIAKPKILKKIGFIFIKLLGKIKLIKSHKMYHTKIRLIREIEVFNRHIKSSFKSNFIDIILIFILTFLIWFVRFISIFPILLLFSNSINITKFIGLQFMITAVNYFSITPGSSGTTDILAAIIFGLFMQKKDIPTFITIWRFFTFHIIVLFSGVMISRILYYFSHHKEVKN
ncbi:MAG TPA: lysylphosphatidylglycerol synthase transmembrane domain-containing protein [Spirochaetota bacterium]|nr:lysylphosphatidylglycerol synthase transmembrane domain-containing protein [Spirochaetota bacterium]HOM38936.1 lysylphosphatidylglycerol synthase transmembrane domain-containing protein [Spirochaetota bacterium]HPQ49194.1 lysylphosphatidylglycerol synthase transmembrane domain-containing protein [Spirochaetota bacterium]